MKRKAPTFRPSPNEEARLLQEELARRRKLRIQQVREQQRVIALNIRQNVEQRRQEELQKLGEQLREEWERRRGERVLQLQREYQERLQLLGQAHRSAKENEPDLAAIAQKEVENQVKAEERFRGALRELKSQRLKDSERQNRAINARNKAMQMEKERAAKVASLPPPPPHPTQSDDPMKPHASKRERKTDLQAFASTHYHMSQATVDREVDKQQRNPKEDAELEMERLQEFQKDERKRMEEQLEKTQLRGQQALRKEQLVLDHKRMLVELEHMQQTDLLRRRQQVSQMPPQIFQPLHKREEIMQDFQSDMEFAFEDACAKERRVKGDLVVKLVPEPLPASSTASQDQELDVTLDETSTSGPEAAHDDEQDTKRSEQETSVHVEAVRPAPRQALRKLLDRIRNRKTNYIAEAASQVPEHDTSIDTGSLSSADRGESSVEVPAPQAAAEGEPMTQSKESDTPDVPPPDDASADRIQEIEEQRRREEELERAKHEQITLLEELEEQKAKLEQMLLEAQAERDHLRAMVSQEAPVKQPDVPAHDQDENLRTQPISPESEDEDTRRIREYQLRLLEQNRNHQSCVEVARQRLEEYQRALRIRHSLTAGFRLPTDPGPGPFPPRVGPCCTHIPTPPHPHASFSAPVHTHPRPHTPEEIPNRESGVSLSPPSSVDLGSNLQISAAQSHLDSEAAQRRDIIAMVMSSIMERFRALLSAQWPEPHEAPRGAEQRQEEEKHRRELEEARRGEEERRRQDLHLQRMLQERQEEKRLIREHQEERRRSEEQHGRLELEVEQTRLQQESHTDTQPPPEVASKVSVSEGINQARLALLASLLRAIEESKGGSLSYLEDPGEEDDSPPPRLPTRTDRGLLLPQRAAKPPVTRVRPGMVGMMPEQHELSVIQEVETPGDTSRVLSGDPALFLGVWGSEAAPPPNHTPKGRG